MKHQFTILLFVSVCFVLMLTVIYNQQIQLNSIRQQQTSQQSTPSSLPSPSVFFNSTTPYKNDLYQYQIDIPNTWETIPHSSSFQNISSWQAPDKSTFEIQVYDSNGLTLTEYISNQDLVSKTGFEGKPSKKVISTAQSKVGQYDSIFRTESWLAAGFDVIASYVKVNDNIFVFYVLPSDSIDPSATKVGQSFWQIISSFKPNAK